MISVLVAVLFQYL